MKAKLLVVSLSLIIAAACSKDKFQSKPTLTFESINGSTFSPGQIITFKLRLTDKEGDFLSSSDSSTIGFMKPYLYYKRFTYVCPNNVDTTTSIYDIPVFPTSKFLDVRFDINYTSVVSESGQYKTLPCCDNRKDDSAYFKFWIKDEAGNVSDTIQSPVFKQINQ